MFFFIFFGNNQCMKKIAMISTFLLVLVLMIGVCFQNNVKTKDENCDYLRIHIRANSNEQVDQDIKFVIKDQFVCFLTPKIADCKAKKDVIDIISKNKQSLENLANSTLKQNGFDYVSNIKIDKEYFPTRTYQGYTLESGIYDAMIVELGTAQGNNWWCVIYPPLCFANYSAQNGTNVVYKSKILEIIKKFFD